MVPLLVRSEELHEANSTLNKSPRDETARSEFFRFSTIEAVHLLSGFRFVGDVESFLRGRLHLCGQFVAGDASGKIVFAGTLGEVLAIELFEVRKESFLRLPLHVEWRVEICDARFGRTSDRSLKQRR